MYLEKILKVCTTGETKLKIKCPPNLSTKVEEKQNNVYYWIYIKSKCDVYRTQSTKRLKSLKEILHFYIAITYILR